MAQSSKSDGQVIVDDSDFLVFFDATIRSLLPSTVSVRFRPENDFADLAFGDVREFVVAAIAAGGANVQMELVTVLDAPNRKLKSIGSCVIRLRLRHHCRDVRLCVLLHDVLLTRSLDGALSPEEIARRRDQIRAYEEQLISQR